METLRVVALKEDDATWVVQALEMDIATQAPSLFDAIDDLGSMLDAHDALQREDPDLQPVSPAPDAYHQMWNAGMALGQDALGTYRWADVRIGTWTEEWLEQVFGPAGGP